MRLPPLTARRFIPETKYVGSSRKPRSLFKRLKDQPLFKPALAQLRALNSLSSEITRLQNVPVSDFKERWLQISEARYEMSVDAYDRVPAALQELLISLTRNPDESKLEALAQTKGPSKLYLVPALVAKLSKNRLPLAALFVLKEVASRPATTWDYATIQFALNTFLRCEKPNLENLRKALCVLPTSFRPSFSKDIVLGWCAVQGKELLPIFRLLVEHSARLDLPGFAPFLRTVYSSTDAGLELVIKESRRQRFPVNFYSFLVSQLVERKDFESADYILNHWMAPLAAQNPQKYLDFVLSIVAKRMLALDAADGSITDLFEQMGPEARVTTLRRLFREFRQNARPDRCRQILIHLDKMDVPFVGELLSFVEQFYNVRVLLDVAVDVFPGFRPVLDTLGISEWASRLPRSAGIVGDLPRLPSAPSLVAMPESWLHIIYRAVLHQSDDITAIEVFWKKYVSYAQASQIKVQTEVLSLFVKRLVMLRHQRAVEMAERIIDDALGRLNFTQPSSGRHGLEGIEQLVKYYCEQKRDPQRAILLVSRLFDGRLRLPMRGRVVRPILDAVDASSRAVIERWAESLGMRP